MLKDGFFISEHFFEGLSAEITKTEFNNLYTNREIILNLIEIEELYTLVPLSYFEFEKKITEFSLEYLIGYHLPENFDRFFGKIRNNLNLTILTLLNAIKAYHDQLSQRLQKIEHLLPKIIEKNKQQVRTVERAPPLTFKHPTQPHPPSAFYECASPPPAGESGRGFYNDLSGGGYGFMCDH